MGNRRKHIINYVVSIVCWYGVYYYYFLYLIQKKKCCILLKTSSKKNCYGHFVYIHNWIRQWNTFCPLQYVILLNSSNGIMTIFKKVWINGIEGVLTFVRIEMDWTASNQKGYHNFLWVSEETSCAGSW